MEVKTYSKEFELAWELHAKGLSVIPSGGGPSGKAPIVAWAEYQKRLSTDNELMRWNDELQPQLWGIVTGLISRVVVIDVDTVEAMAIMGELKPHVRTPRGGAHYYFKHPGNPIKTSAGILPSVDIRADGGFVNAIGGKYTIEISPAADTIYNWNQLPATILKAFTEPQVRENLPQAEGGIIPQTKRNATLASLAGTMRRRGLGPEAIEAALLVDNRARCQPPLPDDEVMEIVKSICHYKPSDNGKRINNIYISKYVRNTDNTDTNVTANVTQNVTPLQDLSERIEEWVKGSSGWFETNELDKELGIISQNDKNTRRVKLFRLLEKDIIEKHPKQNKSWRFVDKQLVELNYKNLEVRNPLTIEMPLGLSKLVNLFPGNLVVLAGTTNAGKTALALDIIRLNNQGSMPAYYFYSEGGAEELRDRLDKCEGMDINEWNFKLFYRSTNFSDVIAPDCLNVVDYLELVGDFWEVNKHLTNICNKIGKGLAVVCIQKKKDATFARGGEFSAEKARLYLALDEAEGRSNASAKIIKGKSWAVKGYNPNGLQTTFHIENGWIKSQSWSWNYDEDESK